MRKDMQANEITTLTRTTSPWQQIEIRHNPKFGNQLIIDGDLQISESDRSYNVAMVSPLMMPGTQVFGENNAWLAIDGIETGYGNRVPLWLFGFLYGHIHT